jgi:hypothetical protein
MGVGKRKIRQVSRNIYRRAEDERDQGRRYRSNKKKLIEEGSLKRRRKGNVQKTHKHPDILHC